MKRLLTTISLVLSLHVYAAPDWSEGALVPEGGRSNPYNLSPDEFRQAVIRGKLHAQHYPVSVTGVLLPARPIKNFIEEDTLNPLKAIMQGIFQGSTGVEKFDDFGKMVGAHPYPKPTDTGVYSAPYPNGQRPNYLFGFTPTQRNGVPAFTFSCAACHSSNLFGKTVLGLTNRFPKANEMVFNLKKLAPLVDPTLFSIFNNATPAEENLLRQGLDSVGYIGITMPVVPGLDTSLAAVSLSLAKRESDAYATKTQRAQDWPRVDYFDNHMADSKPAVWWNVKYKNRWLSDGSVISGNPIFTNFLWNEIGRGTDLRELDHWLQENPEIIKEIATAVFSIEAPAITDFFPAEKMDLDKAKYGQKIYEKTCSRCHGHYDKAWDLPNADQLSPVEKLKTTLVRYKDETEVVDVGTDPQRYLGMKALEKLNDLEISKKNGTVVKAQTGYVPPPLVGIWARWPYLHNNSIPSLCALLTESSQRPETYYAREANDPKKDFDFECNGYPLTQTGDFDLEYDTTEEGLSNSGHDKKIFIKDGKEILTAADKKALIQFLQTL